MEDLARRSAGRWPTPLGFPSVLLISLRYTIMDVPSRRFMCHTAAHTRKGRYDGCQMTTRCAVRLSRTSARIVRPSIPMTRAPQQRLSQSPQPFAPVFAPVCISLRGCLPAAAACCSLLRRGLRPPGALACRGGWGEHGARRRQRVGSGERACFFLSAHLTRAALTSPTRDTRRLSDATLCPKGQQRVCQTWLHADTPPRGQRAMACFSLVSPPGILTIVNGGLSQTTIGHQH